MPSITPLAKPDLGHERSNEIIRFLLRNHTATNDAIHQAILPGVSKTTVQKMLSKLIKRGLLKRWPLHGSKSYLRLGSSAIARWQYPESYSRRLGPQVLPYQIGCFSLFSNSQPPLVRLLPEELESHFPEFPETRDLQQWAYYRDQVNGADVLATVRVEFRVGGDAVISKLSEQIHRYREHDCIARLLDAGRFYAHVVAATEEQERALHDAAERLSFAAKLRTCHDPDLTCFL